MSPRINRALPQNPFFDAEDDRLVRYENKSSALYNMRFRMAVPGEAELRESRW